MPVSKWMGQYTHFLGRRSRRPVFSRRSQLRLDNARSAEDQRLEKSLGVRLFDRQTTGRVLKAAVIDCTRLLKKSKPTAARPGRSSQIGRELSAQ